MESYKEEYLNKQLENSNLDLYKLPIESQVMAYLVSKGTSRATSLLLHKNGLTVAAFQLLPQADWSSLAILQISDNNLGSHGCKYVSRMSAKALLSLCLKENHISGEGLLHLSKSEWKKLAQMDLFGNRLAVNSVAFLLKGSFKQLKRLGIANNRLTWSELTKLGLLDTEMLSELYYGHNICSRSDRIVEKKVEQVLDDKFVNIFAF